MKMSRISLLLSVAVFVAPALTIANDAAPEAAAVTTSQVSTTEASTTQPASTATETAPAQQATTQTAEVTPAPQAVPAPSMATEIKDALVNAEQNISNAASNVEQKVSAEATTVMAAISAFLLARKANVLNGLDTIAYYTFVEAALNKLATFDALSGKFKNNIPYMQRTIVAAALAGLGYAAYQAYVNQNTEDFDADFDADNN